MTTHGKYHRNAPNNVVPFNDIYASPFKKGRLARLILTDAHVHAQVFKHRHRLYYIPPERAKVLLGPDARMGKHTILEKACPTQYEAVYPSRRTKGKQATYGAARIITLDTKRQAIRYLLGMSTKEWKKVWEHSHSRYWTTSYTKVRYAHIEDVLSRLSEETGELWRAFRETKDAEEASTRYRQWAAAKSFVYRFENTMDIGARAEGAPQVYTWNLGKSRYVNTHKADELLSTVFSRPAHFWGDKWVYGRVFGGIFQNMKKELLTDLLVPGYWDFDMARAFQHLLILVAPKLGYDGSLKSVEQYAEKGSVIREELADSTGKTVKEVKTVMNAGFSYPSIEYVKKQLGLSERTTMPDGVEPYLQELEAFRQWLYHSSNNSYHAQSLYQWEAPKGQRLTPMNVMALFMGMLEANAIGHAIDVAVEQGYTHIIPQHDGFKAWTDHPVNNITTLMEQRIQSVTRDYLHFTSKPLS